MGDMYAKLTKGLRDRASDYLRRVITDDATFKKDPGRNGVAKRRGFLSGQRGFKAEGPRPEHSLWEQDQAEVSRRGKALVWTDSSAVRALQSDRDPWDEIDIQSTTARMLAFETKEDFEASIPMPEPLDENLFGVRLRAIAPLLRQLGSGGRFTFRQKIRSLFDLARDAEVNAPDFNPSPVFSDELRERVVISLDAGPEPIAGDRAMIEELATRLSTLTVENWRPSILKGSKLERPAIGREPAKALLESLFLVLPGEIVAELIVSAVENGRPHAYVVDYHGSREPPPSFGGREDPGDFGAREDPGSFGAREDPGTFGAREDPTGGLESANPEPPRPRGDATLLTKVWELLWTLSWFGWVGREAFDGVLADGRIKHGAALNVRKSVLGLHHWFVQPVGVLPEAEPCDKQSAGGLLEEIHGGWTPPWGSEEHSIGADFLWPPYTRVGIFWWHAVIWHQCVEHCFALKDTADFHATYLLRFHYLFSPHKANLAEPYVWSAVNGALLYFKFWFDEPPGNGEEMTFWSENHQILFAQAQVLAGALFRGNDFPRSGDDPQTNRPRTGQSHVTEGLVRAERWLDRRLRFGFSEWNAPGYYDEDFPPLFNLVDFCRPEEARSDWERDALRRVQTKAAMVLDVMIFDCARFTCRGSFGVTAGRTYWSSKSYGWEQSIGNTIEILFATRGDYTETEASAIALATSTYEVPEALLAIGLDRLVLDREQPFTDRTRVSIDFDEAEQYGIGFESEEDIVFWWGLGAYFTDRVRERTKEMVAAHKNLRDTKPFKMLYAIADSWLVEALTNLVSIILDYLKVRAGVTVVVLLPLPLKVVFLALEAKNIADGVADFFKDSWEYLKSISKGGPWQGLAKGAAGGAVVFGWPGAIGGGAVGFVTGLFGDDDDEKQKISETVLQELLEKMLAAFNDGTVLSRANIVTYNNGDAMLSSVQNRLPGKTSFQQQPWMASLGLDACVWTSCPLLSPNFGSYTKSWERFFGDIGLLQFHEAALDLLAPPVVQYLDKGSDLIGSDGPNYWTGSLALPMIVQFENAAIIAYDLGGVQREISADATHAWFPREMFDEVDRQASNGGSWFFGRKDSFDPMASSKRIGSGYVALFSAREADWTEEGYWKDKEISVDGSTNIWVCLVGNEKTFSSFEAFKSATRDTYMNISGLGEPGQLECTFDIPDPQRKRNGQSSRRLELFYSDRKGRLDGADMQLDDFPRFENRYIQTRVGGPPSSVDFGNSSYTIWHPSTELTLIHDVDHVMRVHTKQDEAGVVHKLEERRLVDSRLTARRLVPALDRNPKAGWRTL